MESDAVLASVVRKLFAQRDGYDGAYIDVQRDSMCIDGWVNGLTADEVGELRRLYESPTIGAAVQSAAAAVEAFGNAVGAAIREEQG